MHSVNDSSPDYVPWLPLAEDDGRPLQCTHDALEARLRTLSNGTQAPYWQCLTCGSGVRAVRRDEYDARAQVLLHPPFDDDLAERYRLAENAAWVAYRARAQHALIERSAAWWDDYNAYLESAAWREKSRLRLELDRFACQARLGVCRGRASQVHHLTYKHLRNEPLFELISVCVPCHDAITAMDRE